MAIFSCTPTSKPPIWLKIRSSDRFIGVMVFFAAFSVGAILLDSPSEVLNLLSPVCVKKMTNYFAGRLQLRCCQFPMLSCFKYPQQTKAEPFHFF